MRGEFNLGGNNADEVSDAVCHTSDREEEDRRERGERKKTTTTEKRKKMTDVDEKSPEEDPVYISVSRTFGTYEGTYFQSDFRQVDFTQ
jgi:hypothetical protein